MLLFIILHRRRGTRRIHWDYCEDDGHKDLFDILKKNTLPVSWQTHSCPAVSNCIKWSTVRNDDSHHNQMTFTDAETARHAGCQMLITWWGFFFFQRNVPISAISDYTPCYCSLLKLLLISFRAGWKSHWCFSLYCVRCEISSWRQMTLHWQDSIY